MANKEFNIAEWINRVDNSKKQKKINSTTHTNTPTSLEEEVEYLVSAVESAGIDITPDYNSWLNVGFALADAFGEGGRNFFHRLSRYYPGYSDTETDKQYNACVNANGNGITIKTLFHIVKQKGIKLNNYLSSESSDSSEISDSYVSPDSEVSEDSEGNEIIETPEAMPTFSNEIYSFLPGLLNQVVNKSNDYEDADLLILGTITVISACLPNVFGFYGEREVFPNLFLFVVAPASAGKGRLTLCRNIVKPIHDNLKQLYAAEMDEYKRLQNEYALNKKNNDPPQEPPIKTLLIPANSSATAVYQILNDNNGIGLIFETEGDTLANTFKSDYGNFSNGLRSAFHHEMISYTRRKDREFVEMSKPRLSAVLSGTPKQVVSLIPDAENGLFSRFIFYNMNFRLEWNDVFSECKESLDDYYTKIGQQFYSLYQLLQTSYPIRFSLSISQQQQFNNFFDAMQNEYSSMYGLDIVASVRRLGLITFRIAMVLTTLRIMDGKTISPTIVCDDDDFNNSLIMAKVLMQHIAKVFKSLPIKQEDMPVEKTITLQQAYLNQLPEEFNRQTYLSVANLLKISPRTAESYIHRFCVSGYLKHPAYDMYLK